MLIWDGPGLAIVQLLVVRIGGEPWEMPPLRTRPPRVRYEEDMRAELLAMVAEGWSP
jgi:hypothetical protein